MSTDITTENRLASFPNAVTHLAALLHFMHSPILEQALPTWRYVSSAICWEPVQAHAEEDLKISTSLQGDPSHWGQPQTMLAPQPALQNRNGHPLDARNLLYPLQPPSWKCLQHRRCEHWSSPHSLALWHPQPDLPLVSGIQELINPASAGFIIALNWTAPALHGLLS